MENWKKRVENNPWFMVAYFYLIFFRCLILGLQLHWCIFWSCFCSVFVVRYEFVSAGSSCSCSSGLERYSSFLIPLIGCDSNQRQVLYHNIHIYSIMRYNIITTSHYSDNYLKIYYFDSIISWGSLVVMLLNNIIILFNIILLINIIITISYYTKCNICVI